MIKKNLYFLGLCLFASFTLSHQALGKAKINDISFEAKKKLVIYYQGEIKTQPMVEIKDKIVQVVIEGTNIWPKIDKVIEISSDSKIILSAYQFDQSTARIRATFPAHLKFNKDNINTILEEGKITVEINPYVVKNKTTTAPTFVSKEDSLVRGATETMAESKKETIVTEEKIESFLVEKENKIVPKAKQASVQKTSFSLAPFILKFLAFIGAMLALVYICLNIFKKGIGKKTGLGILASPDSLTVLKTTYLGPKRSLMMVRAHQQVFLIASSEAGVQFISEIKDVPGIIKEGEKELAGNNFDIGLNAEENMEKNFNLKEDITQSIIGDSMVKDFSEGVKNLAGNIKESVKLSDHIRKKVKGLRQLQ